MLVGEHGRVVPFHHFKEIAFAVIAVACLSLAALAVIAYLYAQQGQTIGGLQREVDALRRQTTQLKDEKDVLHARLVIYEMQKPPEAARNPKGKDVGTVSPKTAITPGLPQVPQESQPAAAASPPPQSTIAATPTSTPRVNWVLNLERFDAEYDVQREFITFSIRILNKSGNRQSFSGRMVLVVKQAGAPAGSWVALPNVPLEQGKPSGNSGQTFTVKNYRTMDFKLYKQRPPIDYDTVTVFVFLSNGELLLSRDFGFKIEAKKTPSPTPGVEATPASTPSPAATSSVPDSAPSPSFTPGAGGTPSGNSSENTSQVTGSGAVGTPTQGQQQPQVQATPAAPAPAINPVSAPQKSTEVEPKR